MEEINFLQTNFRYSAFIEGGQYYLLDRRPVNVLCYFFAPLTWLFYQKVYRISKKDYEVYIKRYQKPDKAVVVPTAFIGGISFLLSRWLNSLGLIEKLETNLSMGAKLLILLTVLAIVFFLIELIFHFRKKAILAKINLDDKELRPCKIRPYKSNKAVFKQLFMYFFMLAMIILLILGFVDSGSLFFLFGVWFFLMLLFLANIQYIGTMTYKITKVKGEE